LPTILVIDDKINNLTTIEALIKSNRPDYKIITAQSGAAGIELARTEKPDTILLDINMPEMDGYEVCRRLKADEGLKHIPIVFLTAVKTSIEDRIKGLELGGDAYLFKPVDSGELIAQIDVMLRIKKAEGALRLEMESLEEKVVERTKELSVSEEKLRNIFENSTNLFYSHTPDHILTYLSPQVKDILGYTQEEAMNKWTEFVSDNPINEIGFNHTIEAIKTGKRQPTYELELVKKDGEKLWVEVREAPMVKDGKTVSIVGALADITERKQAEEALRTSENRLKIIFESAPDAYYINDLEGKFTAGNKAAEKLLGYPREELIGKTFVEAGILDVDGVEKALSILTDNINGISTGPDEYNLTRKDGTKVDVSIITHPVIIDDQNLVLGIAHNITNRKLSEEALRESEERFKKLSSLTFEGILIHNKGVAIDVNESLQKMFGYTSEEMIGKNLIELLVPREFHARIQENIIKESAKPYEVVGRKKDGTLFPIELEARDIKSKNVEFRVTAFRDITERKQAEERFRMVSKVTTDLIYEWDVKKNSLEWFGPLDETLGYNPGEIPRTIAGWAALIHPDDQEKLKDSVERHRTHTEPINEEYRVLNKDGTWSYWADMGIPLIDSEGKPYRWFGGCRDITGRKQAEETVAASRDYLERLTNSMGDVVFSVKMPERVIEWVNDSVQLFGYEPGECIGKSAAFFYPDKDEFLNFGNKIKDALAAGKEVLHADQLLKRKSGETFPAEITVTFHKEDDKVISTTITIHDITNRQLMLLHYNGHPKKS